MYFTKTRGTSEKEEEDRIQRTWALTQGKGKENSQGHKGNHKLIPSRVKSPSADLGIRTGTLRYFQLKKIYISSDQSVVFAHTETVHMVGGRGWIETK